MYRILFFLHTQAEFPWTRPGLGNFILQEGVQDDYRAWRQYYDFDEIFDVLM